MRFTYTIFATLAVAAGIAMAGDASPSEAKDAFDKAAVCLIILLKLLLADADNLQIPADLGLKDFKPKAVLDVSFPGPPQPGSQLPPPPIPLEHGGAQIPENSMSSVPDHFASLTLTSLM